MITVADKFLNEGELSLVMNYAKARGIDWGTIYQGNGCIWLATGSSSCPLNYYFIFKEGQLVGIDID